MNINDLRTEQDKVWYATTELVPQKLTAYEICKKVNLSPKQYFRELIYNPEFARPIDFDAWVWTNRLDIDTY